MPRFWASNVFYPMGLFSELREHLYCKLVESERLLFCIPTDINLISYIWRQIAWRYFYTACIWHFLV